MAPEPEDLATLGAEIAGVLMKVVDRACSTRGPDYGRRLVCLLACGKPAGDPLDGMDVEARAVLTDLFHRRGFRRDGLAEHPANVIDLEMLQFLARELEDPDWRVLSAYRSGVRLGWHHRMPRTPAVFERKTRWANHVGDTEGSQEFRPNYSSTADAMEEVMESFQ